MYRRVRYLVLLVMILCCVISTCIGEVDWAKTTRRVMLDVDIPIPNSISKLKVGHIAYSKPSIIEDLLEDEMTLSILFDIPQSYVPESGHILSIESNGKLYNLLLDEEMEIVEGTNVDALSYNTSLKYDQLTRDLKANKVAQSDVDARFDEVIVMNSRVTSHLGLKLKWMVSNVEESAQQDSWHQLTNAQLRNICGY